MSLKIPLTSSLFFGSNYYPGTYIPPYIRRSLGTAALDVTPISPMSYISSPINDVILDNVILNNSLSQNILFPYPMTPIGPLYDSVSYDSVDDDIELRSKMAKYFYVKTFNSWLIQNSKLLKYFKVSGKKVLMLKSKKEYENNNITHDNKEMIVKYILENIFDKYDIKSALKKFVSKSRTKWFNLKDNKEYVRKVIMKEIKRKIKQHYK